MRPFFNHQQKFCSEGHHTLDLSTNLPKLQVWNMLINNAASSLLTPVINICCSVNECSTWPYFTVTLLNASLIQRVTMNAKLCCFVVLTCMFVRRMCFLALLAASLLQEESSTLHHKETLTQAANKWERKVTKPELWGRGVHSLQSL